MTLQTTAQGAALLSSVLVGIGLASAGCDRSAGPAPGPDTVASVAASARGLEAPPDRSTSGRPTASPPAATTPGATSGAAAATAAASNSSATAAPHEVVLTVPSSVADHNERRPFLLLLHGFQGSGAPLARHLDLPRLAAERRLVWAAPDGALDSKDRRFWNAGPSCCDFDATGVDHVGALSALLERARGDAHVDAAKLFVVGYSNGGFMAQRLGCVVAGLAGIASVSGAAPNDLASCPNLPPVIIQAHGDADRTVLFDGGQVLGRKSLPTHPGAAAGLASWAVRAGCTPAAKPFESLDLEPKLDGAETERLRFGPCAKRIELWRVHGGEHDILAERSAFARLVSELLGPS